MSNKISDTLNTRLTYQSGRFSKTAEGRFQNDKLTSLKRALLYSYQACTIVLPDGREFRGLLNPNKLSPDYDNKILSIPFFDIRLNPDLLTEIEDEEGNKRFQTTSEGLEETNIKCGDVITWKETNTKWMVLLRHVEEDAYFRAEVRRCDQKIFWKDENGELIYSSWCFARGPVETDFRWNQKKSTLWNDMNYSLTCYLPRTKDVDKHFHRFAKAYLSQPIDSQVDENINADLTNPWLVAGTNPYYYDNVVEVMFVEGKKNTVEDIVNKEVRERAPEEAAPSEIEGASEVTGYCRHTYTYAPGGGRWSVSGEKLNIVNKTDTSITIEFLTGKIQQVNLKYIKEDMILNKTIKILGI